MEMIIELYQEILDRTDFLCQIRLSQLNRYLYDNLKICDFHNIDSKYLKILSDNILKNYKYVKKLNAYYTHNITDKGISHMNLHTLDASFSCTITDRGISHMNLHTLNASSNEFITD